MYKAKRKKKSLGGILTRAGRVAKDLKLPLGLGVGVGTATSQMKPKNKKVTTGTNSISDAQKKAGGKTGRTAIKEAGRGRGAKPTKNIVTSKNGKAVRDKNGKIVTFGGKNKGGKKSREGR